MLTRIQIDNFRGIQTGVLDELSQLSVLVGPNNSGKSTCLEAAGVYALGGDARSIVELATLRGGPELENLRHMIRIGAQEAVLEGQRSGGASTGSTKLRVSELRGPTSWGIEITVDTAIQGSPNSIATAAVSLQGNEAWGEAPSIAINVGGQQSPPRMRMQFVDVSAVRQHQRLERAVSDITKRGNLRALVAALEKSHPGLTDLRLLQTDAGFHTHAIVTGQPVVPLFLCGDGAQRLIAIANALLGQANELVLIEEPENFQGRTYQREVASMAVAAAQAGTQVLVSTHSLELIDCLLAAASEARVTGFPTIHHTRLRNGALQCVALSAASARTLREQLFEDLRQPETLKP